LPVGKARKMNGCGGLRSQRAGMLVWEVVQQEVYNISCVVCPVIQYSELAIIQQGGIAMLDGLECPYFFYLNKTSLLLQQVKEKGFPDLRVEKA